MTVFPGDTYLKNIEYPLITSFKISPYILFIIYSLQNTKNDI